MNIGIAGNDIKLCNVDWEKMLDDRMQEIVDKQPMLHVNGKLLYEANQTIMQ